MRVALFNSIRSGAVFRDDFNRADENLSANLNWTLVPGGTGTAVDAKVISSQLHHTTAGGADIAVMCPDLGSVNHYVQAEWATTSGSNTFPLVCRLIDHSNWVGLRNNGTTWQIVKRVSGTQTVIGTFSATSVVGDIMRLEVIGSNARALRNGVEIIAPSSLGSDLLTPTRCGTVSRNQQLAPVFDNFESGAL